jgi:uncharacterized RDD family membrane protein YckC
MAEFAAINRRALAGRRRSLVTPEGVDLHLNLAEFGQRAGAFMLDLIAMLLVLIAVSILVGILVASLGAQSLEIGAVIWLLGFFLLRNFYFALLETGPRAATFGKRMLGLRVVARAGDRLTADRVIARNLMREIEFYLPLSFLFYNLAEGTAGGWTALAGLLWTGLFAVFPFFNRDRLRIGDLLAGTWVVIVPRRKLGIDQLQTERSAESFAFTDAQLDVYGIYELQTLEEVLRAGHPETIATVAAAIRHKIGATLPGTDRAFLISYYNAARRRMERNLLYGKRREDKFDRTELRPGEPGPNR